MKEKLQQIREKAIAEIERSDGLERLNEVYGLILGKKGELTAVQQRNEGCGTGRQTKSRSVGE